MRGRRAPRSRDGASRRSGSNQGAGGSGAIVATAAGSTPVASADSRTSLASPRSADAGTLATVASPRGAIFDLDGTLVDSYDAHLDAWRLVARELGHELTVEQFRRQFGRTNEPIIEELCGWAGRAVPDAAGLAEIADRKESLYRERIAASFPVMPGGPDLLRALSAAGWRLAVGSSGPPENVRVAVAGLGAGALFHHCVSGADVSRGKPDPEVFLLAAERLGVPPQRAVVVEDAPAGIEAARRAGMACVGLASKGRTREELAAADLVVDSLESLSPDSLEALLASK